ncbi:hypothetical protein SERLA73DRAFT_179136 [Serpula lacrymans var. lacrymans S7.3]|uniref:Uncharacterized protein n=1 Tax=Serpula lacrymans var. lacrymans (strain S7.3) TaxID=936435 RepID=F8PTT8_SERL3|nr:hypothetical protein SERLA73DRAFT_179136 [Serpula lacrymans var. lacrymans S7.3]
MVETIVIQIHSYTFLLWWTSLAASVTLGVHSVIRNGSLSNDDAVKGFVAMPQDLRWALRSLNITHAIYSINSDKSSKRKRQQIEQLRTSNRRVQNWPGFDG